MSSTPSGLSSVINGSENCSEKRCNREVMRGIWLFVDVMNLTRQRAPVLQTHATKHSHGSCLSTRTPTVLWSSSILEKKTESLVRQSS